MLDTFQLAERARFLEDNADAFERISCERPWNSVIAVPNAVLSSSSKKSSIVNMAIICALYAMVTTTKAPLA